MADLKENQMSSTLTPAYIRGIDENGNSILIPFKDLKNLMFFNYNIVDNVDADTLTATGNYYLRTGITNAIEWSLLNVFNFGYGSAIWQTLVQIGGYQLRYRVRNGETWSSWKSISVTG